MVYLRSLAAPIRQAAGYSSDQIFPLIPAASAGPFLPLVRIELAREAATLLMLVGIALACTKNFRSWLAAFSLAFGVWDLTFYFWLKVLIGWPASLATWDLLFLLPVPWSGPVLAPSLVSLSLIAGGAIALAREPKRVPRLAWLLLAAGAIIIFTSFIWNWRAVAAGAMPEHFPWGWFALGELCGIAGWMKAVYPTRSTTTAVP